METGKKVVIGTMVAVAAVSSSNYVVQAEEASSKDIHPGNIQVSQENITREDVEQAKQDVSKLEEQVAKKSSVVDEKSSKLQEEFVKLQEAEEAKKNAAQEVETATTEAIQEVKSDIKNVEEELSDNKTAISALEDKLATQKQEEEFQASVLAEAEGEKNIASQAYKAIQEKVKKAQNELAGLSIEQAKKEADVASESERTTKQSLRQAEKEYQDALVSDQARLQTIHEKEKLLVQQKQAFDESQQNVERLKQENDSVLAEQEQAKASLEKLQTKFNGFNTIKITPEYALYLKQYATNPTNSDEAKVALKKLSEMNSALWDLNVYKEDSVANDTMVNLNNLSDEEKKTLSLFAGELINQIREQMGVEKVVVSPGAIKFADAVANNYIADGWGWKELTTQGHNNKGINLAAKTEGLEYTEDDFQTYENLYNRKGEKRVMSLNDAKRFVYDSVKKFLFNGNEWDHAKSVAGVKNRLEYFGLDLSVTPESSNVHALFVPSAYIKDSSTFNKSVLENPETKDKLEAALINAKKATVHADQNVSESNHELAVAHEEAEKARQTVNKAQNDFEKASSVKELGPTKKASLEASRHAHETTVEAKKQSLLKVANFQSYIDAKTRDLAKLEQELSERSTAVEATNVKVNSENQKLVAYKKATEKTVKEIDELTLNLGKLKARLASLKQTLKKYEEAPENLRLATETVALIQDSFNKLKEEYNNEFKELESLKAKLAEKQSLHAELSAKYMTQNVHMEGQHIPDNTNQSMPTFNSKGEYLGERKVFAPVKISVNYNTNDEIKERESIKDNSYRKYLPNTGEESYSFSLFLGLMLLGVSVYKLSPRFKKELE